MTQLSPGVTEGMFYKRLADRRVRCDVCPHHCVIEPDQAGLCDVRRNTNGRLFLEAGALGVIAHPDPIEKKPFYHVQPGSQSYSIGVPGCNMDCPYCINWELSQPARVNAATPNTWISPEDVVAQAVQQNCRSVAFTYTEPAVFLEYVLETSRLAEAAGLARLIKSNGFLSPQALSVLIPHLSAANVDLKCFSETTYRELGGQLRPVLDTLRRLRAADVWLEVTTLIVPGQNDSDTELSDMAHFIANELGKATPWHILRFFPGYRMLDTRPTPMATLTRAVEIGQSAGLPYVYLSNLRVSGAQDTHCATCGHVAIARSGVTTPVGDLTGGECARCHAVLPGCWA